MSKPVEASVTSGPKIAWRYGGNSWRPYTMSEGLLEEATAAVRKAVQNLVDARCDGSPPDTGLSALAIAGYRLYETVFGHKSGRPIQNYLETCYDTPAPATFTIRTDLQVPWGLIYDRDPEASGALDIERFWCVKYKLGIQHVAQEDEGGSPDDLWPLSRPGNPKLVLAVNQQLTDRLVAELQGSERAFWDWLTGAAEGLLTSPAALKSRGQADAARAQLVYFLCHASEQSLAIGANGQGAVTPADISHWYKLPRLDGGVWNPCLFILNGCRTALRGKYGSFHEVTVGPGLCGFVGTEAEVPDLFALRFSLALLSEMLGNRVTLAEAMWKLRRAHLPLSLMYSVNGNPDFRFDPLASAPPPVEFSNCSDRPQIGRERLRGGAR